MAINKIFNFKRNTNKYIFILGTGRSGTHLLARSIGSCSEVDANIENSEYFKLLTYAAIFRSEKKDEEIECLIIKYKSFLQKSNSRVILDKTHPNLWLIDLIDKVFPNSYYIGIKRNVYATVNSMLNHQGVLDWYNEIDLTKPNKFLGITEENVEEFKLLPLESKCALRWRSHNKELLRLSKEKKNFLLINYEEFYKDLDSLSNKLNKYLNEDFKFNFEELNQDGDVKWKTMLSLEQIENIVKVLE